MQKLMQKLSFVAPFLLAVFPFVYVFNYNKGEFPLNVIWLPSMAVFIITAVVFIIFKVLIKDSSKTAIIASLVVAFLFYYGFVYNLLSGWNIGDIIVGRHKFLLPFWFLIFSYAAYYVLTAKRYLKEWSAIFVFSSLVLILPSVFNILIYEATKPEFILQRAEPDFVNDAETKSLKINTNKLPDIYYIIPDAYAGYDVLEKYYGFKNDEFYGYLNEKGFIVAKDSRSNYTMSYSSLSSTLDMRYINYLGDLYGVESKNVLPMREIIADNRTIRSLKDAGYEYFHFDSDQTTFLEGESFLDSGESPLDVFSREVLKTTILRPLPGRYGFRKSVIDSRIRENVLTAFDNLKNIPETEGPKFVFAHIASPHGPYVFGSNGEDTSGIGVFSNFRTTEEEMGLYLDQLLFVNKKLIEIIGEILSGSQEPPIIIIQSDHGPFLPSPKYSEDESKHARFQNFSAYYLPGKPASILPQKMSAVNTFRLIFDNYFGTDYGLLEHKSYYSDTVRFYLLEEIDAY